MPYVPLELDIEVYKYLYQKTGIWSGNVHFPQQGPP